ncbi:MAG: transcription repressor NadR, partial [Erysipelothrix sp.]|nr:transcription repressor NadR [Erysipelothrix sp.]
MGINRRKKILETIASHTVAISASKLADMFDVSRQVIVGDVALLRAQGEPIKATARGYVIIRDDGRYIAKVAVNHSEEDTKDELLIIVSLGAYILDVIVEHPVYGEISGQLDIKTIDDVDAFINNFKHNNIELLSKLTKGIHLHTLSCESQKHYDLVCCSL